MSREQDILKEACAQIAMEETDALKNSISPRMEQAADALYMRHRRKIFALIAQNSKKRKERTAPYFRAAACLVLILGAAWMLMHQNTRDSIPATQLPTATIMPFYTMEPSPSPVPTSSMMPEISTKEPKITEEPTVSPTEEVIITEKPTEIPTELPTTAPTSTPIPTLEPTAAPTLTPEPVRKIRPDDWTGIYFPDELPEACVLLESREEEGSRTAVYTDSEGRQIIFTEYDGEEMIPIPEQAAGVYMPLQGDVALRITTDDAVILVWQKEGRTLVVAAPEDIAMEIAESVKKISEE